MILSPSELLRRVFKPASDRAQSDGGLDVVGNTKAKISASGLSTGIPITLPHETSGTAGPKLHKQIQPYGNRHAAPIAGDPVAVHIDRNNNRWIAGKYVDVGSSITDAEYLVGLRPVAPGNTLLLTAAMERNTNSASYVDIKRFYVTRPGAYRIKGQLSRTGGQTKARVVIELSDGTKLAASSEATYSGTIYPTFGSTFTLDMTQPAPWGTFIVIQLLNDSGPAQTGYVTGVTVNYADATANLGVYDAVVTD